LVEPVRYQHLEEQERMKIERRYDALAPLGPPFDPAAHALAMTLEGRNHG